MKNTYLSHRFSGLVAAGVIAAALLMIVSVVPSTDTPAVTNDEIPLPFSTQTTQGLAGQLVTLGQKRGVTVRHVSFDNDEVSENLRGAELLDSMDFILTPDSDTISHGASLCRTITTGKKYFGYKYTSRAATLEKDRHDAALTGAPSSFPILFPGEFFVSAEQRADTTVMDIPQFEIDTNITFADSCDVTLEKNSRYVIKVMDTDVTFTARGIAWCGNDHTDAGEECDDGNDNEHDRCDNQCRRTGNWWIDPEENIPSPGIPGPLLTFDTETLTMGKRLALPSGRVVQLWYSGQATSATTNQHLYASHYQPGNGWGEIVTINDGLGWVQAYGAQQVWFLPSDQEDLFIIFNTSIGSYRISFRDGAWTVPILLSDTDRGITVHDHATGTEDRIVVVYSMLVPISQDLYNHPIFGAHLAEYTWDEGLFAQMYAGGQWSVPTMLQTLYHTAEWQQSVLENPHANMQPDMADIMSVSDDVFTIEWYGEELTYNGAN